MMMKKMNRNLRRLVLLFGGCVLVMLIVHTSYISRPHTWFSAAFPGGEELVIVWQPSPKILERLCGRGKLLCTVTGAKPLDLVYGQYRAYQSRDFVKQDAVAWDENDENRIPAYTITETVQGVQWGVDHEGRFLGSN